MTSHLQSQWADLLKEIREESIGLLAHRYIFRTIQEILRRNARAQEHPGAFIQWTSVVYVTANTAGVRRLAGQSPDKSDVSLIRLLAEMTRHAGELWAPFQRHFPTELAQEHDKAVKRIVNDAKKCKLEACRRLITADCKVLIDDTDKAIHFANKRVAHRNHLIPVHTTFKDLDRAVDTITTLTEKYLLLVYGRAFDLHKDMKDHKLPNGWDGIFLIPWATPDILALPLGEMVPPRAPGCSRST